MPPARPRRAARDARRSAARAAAARRARGRARHRAAARLAAARASPRSRASLVYFGSTARLPLAEFHAQLAARSRRAYLADLAAQQHVNSRILAAKFGHLARAFSYLWWSFAAFVPACFVLWCMHDDEPRLGLAPPPGVAPAFMWLLGRTTA